MHTMGGGIFMAENTGDVHQPVNPDQNSPIERTFPVGASRPKEVVKPLSRHTPPIPVAGGADPMPDILSYTDTTVQNIAMRIQDQINLNPGRPLEPQYLSRQIQEVEDLANRGTINVDEARRLIGRLEGFMVEATDAVRREASEERFGFYLQPQDIELLRRAPIVWLNNQFDTLYRLTQEGQELTSPVVNNMQTVVSEAIRFLQYVNPEMLDRFQTLFTTRFNLMSMRTVMGYRNIENIQSTAFRLRTHGLLYGLTFEDRKVASMFHRMHELLEDTRLKGGGTLHHVDNEMVSKLQNTLIEEQKDLAEKGVGLFADVPQDTREADITRTVRTAYDIFVSSQRQAVIVARGRRLSGDIGYASDPIGALNVYNLEDLLAEKFDIWNAHDEEFVREMKLDLADVSLREKDTDPKTVSEEEKEELGRKLFRDLFLIPDFFSSGWRIDGILKSLEERIGEEKAEDFALFMRLKYARGANQNETTEARRNIWEKITKYRPEEIIRLFRERREDRIAPLFREASFQSVSINNYDEFKTKYGSVLSFLRQQGFRQDVPVQIDMGSLSPEQIPTIDMGELGQVEGNQVVSMFKAMQSYIEENGLINLLLTDSRFDDVYTRTLLVDDVLLDRLESSENGLVPISEQYAADQGGDALVRIWSDTASAIKGGTSLIAFVKTENPDQKTKAAEEFAEATSQYNGQGARARCIRFTIGTFLNLSKANFIWDAVGVGKLPFRTAMSKIEKIYGPQARPLSRDVLRDQLDKIHVLLVSALDKETPEEMALPKEEREKRRSQKREEAEKTYKELEKRLEVTLGDTVKRRILSFLLYLILAALLEGYQIGKSAVEMRK